jgi:Mrp family chromosome partitioning ATPase
MPQSGKAMKASVPSVAEEMPRALEQGDRAAGIARAWAQLRPAVVDAPDMRQSLQASVARAADTVVSQSFDLLRMRLLQTLKDNGWRRVAITSPTPGCGSTFVACNLAVSLSRIREERTLLMDLNLRSPAIAHAFALRDATDMAGFLAGEVSARESIQRFGENVALGAGRSCVTATAEMLYDTRTISALDRLERDLRPDVVLFDLPPMLAYDDVSAFLPQVDGVLLISNGTKTMGKEIAACERAIAGRTKLLGVVLNETRKSDSKAAGYRNA